MGFGPHQTLMFKMLTCVAALNFFKLPDGTLPMGINHGDSVLVPTT